MLQCTSCSGFVPSVAETCPHCGMSCGKPRGGFAKTVVRTTIALGASMTLMACYGGPVEENDYSVGAREGTGGGLSIPTGTGGAASGGVGGEGGADVDEGGAGGASDGGATP